MKQGTLFFDTNSGRYNVNYKEGDGDERDYGGIHCGEVFDFKLMVYGYRREWNIYSRWRKVGRKALTEPSYLTLYYRSFLITPSVMVLLCWHGVSKDFLYSLYLFRLSIPFQDNSV